MQVNTSSNLHTTLIPVARWMRWNGAVRSAAKTLLIVSIFWLIACSLSKFLLLSPWFLPSLLLTGVMVILITLLIQCFRGASISDAARLADQRLGLKERLSTVCELDDLRDQSEVASLLRRDAAQHLAKVVPVKLVSIRLPRGSRWTLAALALTGIVFQLPDFQLDKKLKREAEREMIKSEGQRIELLARRMTENPALLPHKEAPQDLKKVNEVAKLLSGGITKNDALRELTKLTDDLKRREQSLLPKDGVEPLDRQTLRERESFSPEQMQALQKQINALQQRLGKTPASEKQIQKLSQALKQAREMAKDANKGSGNQGLADSLNQSLGDANAAQLSEVAEQLQKAVAALEGADVGQVLKHVDDAIVDLEQARQQAEALSNLMKQASKAGKDLAEQLQRGQSKLAQQSLENFKKQVDQSALTPEQKQQLINELTKALDPARDYGKLSEHLQQAAGQCQAGNQGACSQSLQKAIDELQQQSQQQSQQMQLAQLINELQRSSMMIGTGCCAGMDGSINCLGPPRIGEGGKPGTGVGTWPEHNGDPYYTDLWDNSGANRPDMVPKGRTDRGDPTSPQGTKTLKVTGRMGSGGPMPGIPLQGVFIKGESNVKVEEAFSAAAQEAESALTMESVPVTHQETVKEYFDLK